MSFSLRTTVAGSIATAVLGAVGSLAAPTALAGTGTFFTPLTQSSAVATPNQINELNSPWQTPAGVKQEKLLSLSDVEADVTQSIVRVPGLGSGASMFDMIAYDPYGNYLFIPHETANGAGGSRVDVKTGDTQVLFSGDASGQRGVLSTWGTSDWGAFDPARFTPAGTVVFGEEWSGLGRVIEITNPYADPADIEIRELDTIPNVAHEGIMWSRKNKSIAYFVDEWNSGSIYRIKFKNPFDYSKGAAKVWVLKVRDFDGDAAANWNDPSNENTARTGMADWVRIQDTENDPFRNGISSSADNPDTFGGRPAADELGGTPYGRPEDVEVGKLASGTEVLYFTATSERSIYSVEMLPGKQAMVRLMASDEDTPKNKGFLPTTAELNSPDNLAQDALGNIYVIEDAPNGSDVGGDVWFLRDQDGDGVAESADHFLSLQVDGAEHTGMIFNPANPLEFVMAVQHPDSTNLDNVPEGHGDAVWTFNLRNVVPPICKKRRLSYGHRDYKHNAVTTCSEVSDFNFVKKLKKAARRN